MIAPCQHHIDSTLKNFYNIYEVSEVAMKPGTKTITLRVPEELYVKIVDTAKNEERSINNFVAYSVKEYIAAKAKLEKK